MDTSAFDYHLPEQRIAQTPVEPRHSSRLLDTRDLTDHRFSELPDLLQAGDLLVVNRTRVRSARLHGQKEGTGGNVELLLLRRLPDDAWEAMARPARRLRAGTRLRFGDLIGRVLTDPVDGIVKVVLHGDGEDIEVELEKVGEMPLPPYITTRLDDPGRYQTVFADRPGSAAAPTAGLHFTPQLVDRFARVRNRDDIGRSRCGAGHVSTHRHRPGGRSHHAHRTLQDRPIGDRGDQGVPEKGWKGGGRRDDGRPHPRDVCASPTAPWSPASGTRNCSWRPVRLSVSSTC